MRNKQHELGSSENFVSLCRSINICRIMTLLSVFVFNRADTGGSNSEHYLATFFGHKNFQITWLERFISFNTIGNHVIQYNHNSDYYSCLNRQYRYDIGPYLMVVKTSLSGSARTQCVRHWTPETVRKQVDRGKAPNQRGHVSAISA